MHRKIELRGSSFEIGLQHGQQLKEEIHRQKTVYEAMFLKTSNTSWDQVRTIAKQYQATIEDLTPDLFTEIQGIAEGSELEVLDIVALNARSEIALGMFSDGCSSLGWNRGEEGVILSQNWDWTARVSQNLALMSIEKPGKPKVWLVNEAGMLGKIGFNEAGVGVCFNAIRAKPANPQKLPIHVALRLLLENNSMATSIDKLQRLGSTAAAVHALMADKTGPLGLELSPNGDVILQPNSDGLVCHTNHFIQNKRVFEPPWLSGSPIRLQRLHNLTNDLVKRGEKVDSETLRERIFSDVFNAPQAICCQEDPTRPTETRSSTLFNIIMRFAAGKAPYAEVVWGQPGSGKESEVQKVPW